jgi:hypothetical protein
MVIPEKGGSQPRRVPFVPRRQADPEWGQLVTGYGDPRNPKHTLGWIGCFVTAAAMAYDYLSGVPCTPAEMNEIGKKAKAFADGKGNYDSGVRVLFNVERALASVGVLAPERWRVRAPFGDPGLSAAVIECLDQGGVCIIHVDHDRDEANGDPEGDHFIFAARRIAPTPQHPAHILCYDPATGRDVWLSEDRLEGTTVWRKKPKHFRGVGVVRCMRKPA